MRRRLAAAVALSAALGLTVLTPRPAAADWLPPGSDLGADRRLQPRQVLASELAGEPVPFLVRLGQLAFRSPEILGGNARRAGLSCDTCHSNGASNSRLFIPGLSDRPGTVDVSHQQWNPRADDGRDDPLPIPSLRGVGATAPYGFRGRFASLPAFTRHVIVEEFAGDPPSDTVLAALAAYLDELAPLPAPSIGPLGRLTAAAPAAARRGEAVFAAHCAGCHLPSAGFQDGRRHDVGSGGPVDTPSLRGERVPGRFFHDGRFAEPAAAVAYFEDLLGLRLSGDERNDLLAYLAVLRGEDAPVPLDLAADLRLLQDFAALLTMPLLDEDGDLAELVARMLRGELGRLHRRFPAPERAAARQTLADWARQVAAISDAAVAGRHAEARRSLAALQSAMTAGAPAMFAARPGSLYDAAGQ